MPALPQNSSSVVAACAGALLLTACPLDERGLGPPIEVTWTFHPAAGEGGEGGGGGASEGGQTSSNAGSPPGVPPDPVAPRRSNWAFDQGAEGWEAEPDSAQRWIHEDAFDDSSSGSLSLVNTVEGDGYEFWMTGTSRCVAVRPDTDYVLSVDLFIPRDQVTGAAGFGIEFFNAPDCQGLLLDLTGALTAITGGWETLEKPRRTPAGVKSALLRLVVTKVEKNPPFEARFDNVHFAED